MAAAAGGAGVIAGWYAISGRLWVTPPHLSVDDLTPLAAAMLLIGLLCARLGPGRGASVGMLLAAAFAGWWLSGAPMHLAGLRADWPIALGVAVAVLLFARALAASMLEPLRLALAGLTMAASLHVVAAPPVWALLALVPALAALAMLALPAMPGPVALPVAADIAAVGSLAVIAIGRFTRLRGGIDRRGRLVAFAGALAGPARGGAAAVCRPRRPRGGVRGGGCDRRRGRMGRAPRIAAVGCAG